MSFGTLFVIAISHDTHKGRLKRRSSGSGKDLLWLTCWLLPRH